jgi:ankyrin repeat protein
MATITSLINKINLIGSELNKFKLLYYLKNKNYNDILKLNIKNIQIIDDLELSEICKNRELTYYIINNNIKLIDIKTNMNIMHFIFDDMDVSVELLKLLLNNNFNNMLILKDNNGYTPLHYLCKNIVDENINLLKAILTYYIKNKLNIDILNKDNETPLHIIYYYLCDGNKVKCIKYMSNIYLTHKLNIYIKNDCGLIPLQNMLCEIHYEFLKDDNNQRNLKYIEQVKSIITFYIENNLNINDKDNDGKTLLHNICERVHNLEFIKYVIELYIKYKISVQCKDNDGWSALHYACRFSSPNIIYYMIKSQHFNIQDPDNIKTYPIHLICKYSTEEMIKFIFDFYFVNNYNFDISDCNGWKPIHVICKYSTNSPEANKMIKYILNMYKIKKYDLFQFYKDNIVYPHLQYGTFITIIHNKIW